MRQTRNRILGLLVVAVLACAPVLYAGWATFEQIAIAGTAKGLTATNYNAGSGHPAATYVLCYVRTAQLSVRWDGGTPTASVGTVADIGASIELDTPWKIVNFLAIRTTSTSGQLDCTYQEFQK